MLVPALAQYGIEESVLAPAELPHREALIANPVIVINLSNKPFEEEFESRVLKLPAYNHRYEVRQQPYEKMDFYDWGQLRGTYSPTKDSDGHALEKALIGLCANDACPTPLVQPTLDTHPCFMEHRATLGLTDPIHCMRCGFPAGTEKEMDDHYLAFHINEMPQSVRQRGEFNKLGEMMAEFQQENAKLLLEMQAENAKTMGAIGQALNGIGQLLAKALGQEIEVPEATEPALYPCCEAKVNRGNQHRRNCPGVAEQPAAE